MRKGRGIRGGNVQPLTRNGLFLKECQGLEPLNHLVSYGENLTLGRRGVISGKRWTKVGFLGFLAPR